jgi:hypothetical protein
MAHVVEHGDRLAHYRLMLVGHRTSSMAGLRRAYAMGHDNAMAAIMTGIRLAVVPMPFSVCRSAPAACT